MPTVTRLLDAIKPISYNLTIEPNLEKFTFNTTEEIVFELVQASTSLTFHAVGLNLMVATIYGQQASESPVVDDDAQIVTFTFAEALTAGEHTLRLQFSGDIGEGLHGFYRSNYEHEGKQYWLATTQFEAVHAREAFVCIDEPSAKAVFKLKLIVDGKFTALSNTNVTLEEVTDDGRKTLTFAPTPKMSTYLVAYIIGELEYVEAKTKEDVLIRVYATPGKKSQLDFALDTATKCLSFFGEYFDIAYPLPKLDMVAIPDFGAGAMENWGLVTYRESALLLDPTQTSLGNRQRVAEVVAHELAHQWFGNLVTMAWWNDLWLNEGFASWIEVLAQDKLFPEWQIWEQFVTGDIAHAMDLDSLANTHPIEVEIDNPRQLDEIFDAISYAKGASIIHMVYHYLGETSFRDGLRLYLKRHIYGNTVTADLWSALGEVSKQPVSEVVGGWTSQPGYPIISLDDVAITQQRYFASPREAEANSVHTTWSIPMTEDRLVTKASEPIGDLAKMTKLNPGQAGFYRIRYDLSQIKTLTPLLEEKSLSAIDRYGIVDDVYAAASAGLTDSATALTLTEALRNEPDYNVWMAVSGGFGQILGLLPNGPLYEKGEDFGRWLIKPNLDRLGWSKVKDEPYFDTLMRTLILRQAVRFDDPATIKEARRQFVDFLSGKSEIDPDLRPAVYSAVARNGNEADYETILDLYRKETVPQEKLRFLSTLSVFKQPELALRTLKLGMNPKEVRSQDTVWLLSGGLGNRYSRDLAWKFLQDNWEELVKRYGKGGHMLDSFVNFVGSALTTHAEAKEVKAFFAKHPHPAIARPVLQAVEAITQRADWLERDKAVIEKFFEGWKA
jgi:puromycin-sensitive aminopeptidase